MTRNELDALAAHHGLGVDAVGAMLDIADARPTPADLRRFAVRVLHLSGVLSVAAGVVFFVAANWNALAVFGRFALVQGVIVAAVAIALWRPAPHPVGRYALLLAFVVSGALFALFGQTYQTGADVYELFLNWALLGSVLVVAAQWSVVWAAWALVLNVALWLFFGARPETGPLWFAFSLWQQDTSVQLIVPLLVNVALWGVCLRLERTTWSDVAPAWLGRFVLTCAVAFGTWAGMLVVLRDASSGFVGLIAPLLVFVLVGWHTLRRRIDVFPLALIEASLILLSTTWIAQAIDWDEEIVFFALAAWLIVTSTVSGHWLMKLVRAWEPSESGA
jgi:uncharacterized membrane protein